MYCLREGNIYAVPVLHYNMECADAVRTAFESLDPDCVAVELAETMEEELLTAAARLPDVSVVASDELLYLCEPCDGALEGLRSALEMDIPCHCIDLDVASYPDVAEPFPDPHAITRIGLGAYFEAYEAERSEPAFFSPIDDQRELHMARRLKELSIRHETVLFVCGMSHVRKVMELVRLSRFPTYRSVQRSGIEICTLTEESCREVMGECGFMTRVYESAREEGRIPDRQKIWYQLLKKAAQRSSETVEPHHMRLIMRYMRNYALVTGRLVPDLMQLLTAVRGCVNHNFAYEVWELATQYPMRRNIDNLEELDLSAEEVWGYQKTLRFHLKRREDKSTYYAPGPYSLCSHQPEDLRVERFGSYLKKKSAQLMTEEKVVPFTTSLEDGIDMRETIRHWHEKKLYVKVQGKSPAPAGSVVLIFDSDREERYPWRMSWLGEHDQESDMALYATPPTKKIIGPGISRCEYGGLMMTYPPRRLHDVWQDPGYADAHDKAEVLLMAAIDYAVEPIVAYVAKTPPREELKQYAARSGKRIAYMPIGQLSPVELAKIRRFHVLDGSDKREIADDYI